MRKLVLAMAGAAALAISSAAGAQVTVVDTSITDIDGPTTVDGTTTIGYTEAGLDNPTFSEYLTFMNEVAGVYSITLDTSSTGVDFTSAVLTGMGGPYNLTPGFDNGTVEFWELSNLFLEAGEYTLTINGDNNATGSLGGTITITPAIPEPGTWAMMLLGFGAAGYAMRRRRAPVLAQAA